MMAALSITPIAIPVPIATVPIATVQESTNHTTTTQLLPPEVEVATTSTRSNNDADGLYL